MKLPPAGYQLLVLPFLAMTAATNLKAAPIFFDDFSTLNTSTVWTTANTAGANAPIASGGFLNETVTSTAGSQRSTILTQASSFNPFAQALTFTFSGLSLNTSTTGAGTGNSFYAVVGRANTDTSTNYNPTSANYTTAGALVLRVLNNTTSDTLSIFDYGAANASTALTLSGDPTSISWTIDGTGTTKTWSVTLTGATFAGGSSVTSGTFVNFTLAGIGGASPISRLAIGGQNAGTVSTGSVVGLDSVTVVPEPGTTALIGLAAGFMLLRSSRRLLRMTA